MQHLVQTPQNVLVEEIEYITTKMVLFEILTWPVSRERISTLLVNEQIFINNAAFNTWIPERLKAV